MKKIKHTVLLILISIASVYALPPREFFELRIYRFKTSSQQERVEEYLQKALVPALHRMGTKKIGVFKPLETDSTFGKKLYLFIPFRSLEAFEQLDNKLSADKQYLADGKAYIDASFDNAPYTRFETILLKSFEGMPESAVPSLATARNERVYELRSYEGHTEKIYRNKVQMFNVGDEIGLFKRLGFNAVFYAEVFAGSTMPNLMYMTTFENQASRDAHWKAFSEDPQWKKLVAMPEYQHNVSKNVTLFLRPTDYSDI